MAEAAFDYGMEGGEKEEVPLSERLQGFCSKLHVEAKRRVDRRNIVEQRWLEDLRQYHGSYDDVTLKKLVDNEGSQVFINLTATKTDALEARLLDLLFPTDDRNWGIDPTPVPELVEGHEGALSKIDALNKQADVAQQEAEQFMDGGNREAAVAAEGRMRGIEQQVDQLQAEADRFQSVIQEADARCRLMEKEIDDALVESKFKAAASDAISDGCKIGFGVLKGPIRSTRQRQKWTKGSGEGGPVWVLQREESKNPAVVWVDPWSYFPDPDQKNPEDGEGDYERHLMNRKQLRKLARDPGMNLDAIRDLLRTGPGQGVMPSYLPELHEITGQSNFDIKDAFVVWEYTGPIDSEDLELLVEAFRDDKEGADDPDEFEIDPLEEIQARIFFCEDKVLSFALHPLDSCEGLYSIFSVRKDESSPFGFGIPFIMRDPQSVLNAAFRMMMDNSGLSVGPQIVVNKQVVTPEDGNWRIKSRKVWLRNSTAIGGKNPPFETFNIDSHQNEIANIIAIAQEFIDDVTAQPAIAQGEQGVGVTKTAQGMALLMNSANVVFRRIVRCFDDDVMTPIIRRLYHWFMQFSDKEEIKGDYEVKARGSSVLLVREMQAQNLIMIAQMFGDHPTYGPRIKHEELLRQIFRAHMVPADSITRTEREFQQWMQEQQQNVSPEQQLQLANAEAMRAKAEADKAKIDADVAMTQMETEAKIRVAELSFDAQMEQIAQNLNISIEKLYEASRQRAKDRETKERIVAVEAALARETGQSAGGSV